MSTYMRCYKTISTNPCISSINLTNTFHVGMQNFSNLNLNKIQWCSQVKHVKVSVKYKCQMRQLSVQWVILIRQRNRQCGDVNKFNALMFLREYKCKVSLFNYSRLPRSPSRQAVPCPLVIPFPITHLRSSSKAWLCRRTSDAPPGKAIEWRAVKTIISRWSLQIISGRHQMREEGMLIGAFIGAPFPCRRRFPLSRLLSHRVLKAAWWSAFQIRVSSRRPSLDVSNASRRLLFQALWYLSSRDRSKWSERAVCRRSDYVDSRRQTVSVRRPSNLTGIVWSCYFVDSHAFCVLCLHALLWFFLFFFLLHEELSLRSLLGGIFKGWL